MRHKTLAKNLSNGVKLLSRAQCNLYTQFSLFIDHKRSKILCSIITYSVNEFLSTKLDFSHLIACCLRTNRNSKC